MGILQKNPPDFGLSPIPPLTPSFCLPQMKFDPYPNRTKSILDLHIRKKSNWWRNMEHFAANFFRCSLLSNVANIPKVSLWWVVSKIMHIYSPITQKHLNVQFQNLCHWNQHIQKPTCVEYQAILSISPWSKWGLFLSIAFPIWKPYFSLTVQKQSCFWPGRTAQNHLKVCYI